MKSQQFELSAARDCFNLAGEEGDDPLRLMAEKLREQRAKDEAREYERKYQRQLAECPGFVGTDPPRGPGSVGKVVIEPARINEAMTWLARRFQVAENLEISHDQGLCIEIIPRAPRKAGVRRKRAVFGKLTQYELSFE
jgi:hypothetical protein